MNTIETAFAKLQETCSVWGMLKWSFTWGLLIVISLCAFEKLCELAGKWMQRKSIAAPQSDRSAADPTEPTPLSEYQTPPKAIPQSQQSPLPTAHKPTASLPSLIPVRLPVSSNPFAKK